MPDLTDDDIIIMFWWWRRRKLRRKRRAAPSSWVSEFLQKRSRYGAYLNLVSEVRYNDLDRFINFHRMTPETFDYLLDKVTPHIIKQDFLRESLSPGLRLSLTLRYLASGDSMVSLHYLYRVSKSSITRIIPETSNALWQVLAPEVLIMPSKREWEKIAQNFYNKWDFSNCVGAIDGKHVVMQCPSNTGSQFYNYKGTFSLVLMAVCDAAYKFTYVSIGAAGRESDGGVFESSLLGQSIMQGTSPLPDPKTLPGWNIVAPHVFVGDNAFPLKENIMRPYPGTNLPPSKMIFNYRLSRARRLIENSFGILSNKFRVFRRPIIASVSTVENVVKAAVVLHNLLISIDQDVPPRQRQYMQPGLVDSEDRDGNLELGSWRNEMDVTNGLQVIPASKSRNPTVAAREVQAKFAEYFMTYSQVPFQWRKLPERERRFLSQ